MSSASDSPATAAFEEFLENKGDVEKSVEAYRRVLRRFQSFVQTRGETLETATGDDYEAWLETLREEWGGSTVATYATYVHQFYKWRFSTGRAESNPMYEAYQSLSDFIEKDPDRRDISIAEMREFVASVGHPLDRAVIITLLKTGMRSGELCNLDMADLRHGGAASLRIAGDIKVGETIRGETRNDANKRAYATHVPIDGELEYALRQWLCMRPDVRSPADPVFVSTGDDWGKRLTPATIGRIVKKHTRRAGWYRAGDGPAENVTPHYFRHFFTTWMRERIGETGSVAYLRGDVIRDGSRPYLHNWQDRAQTAYRENIYSVGGGR